MTETTHMGPDTVGALSPAAATADSNAAILARLDAMSAQMAVMAEQVAEAAAAREQWSELVETLIPVSRGAMDVATRELSELEADVTIDDVTRFARTTARAIPDMEVLVGQIGSISELGHEVSSLGGAGMAKLTEVLQVAEDKGYFMFAREGAAIADRVVTTYTEDDVRALGDNVVTDPQRGQGADPARGDGHAQPDGPDDPGGRGLPHRAALGLRAAEVDARPPDQAWARPRPVHAPHGR